LLTNSLLSNARKKLFLSQYRQFPLVIYKKNKEQNYNKTIYRHVIARFERAR